MVVPNREKAIADAIEYVEQLCSDLTNITLRKKPQWLSQTCVELKPTRTEKLLIIPMKAILLQMGKKARSLDSNFTLDEIDIIRNRLSEKYLVEFICDAFTPDMDIRKAIFTIRIAPMPVRVNRELNTAE